MRPPVVRNAQAGVTLIEVLVVLVLIGIMAGVVGLSIGSANRGDGAGREAQLLTARLNRAADEIVLTDAPVAFVWTERDYRFLALQDGTWVAHPIAVLGTAHEIEGDLRFLGEAADGGRFVVLASLLPAEGRPLMLSLGANEAQAQSVVFDGASARILIQRGS